MISIFTIAPISNSLFSLSPTIHVVWKERESSLLLAKPDKVVPLAAELPPKREETKVDLIAHWKDALDRLYAAEGSFREVSCRQRAAVHLQTLRDWERNRETTIEAIQTVLDGVDHELIKESLERPRIKTDAFSPRVQGSMDNY
jgi:hypothetical protein